MCFTSQTAAKVWCPDTHMWIQNPLQNTAAAENHDELEAFYEAELQELENHDSQEQGQDPDQEFQDGGEWWQVWEEEILQQEQELEFAAEHEQAQEQEVQEQAQEQPQQPQQQAWHRKDWCPKGYRYQWEPTMRGWVRYWPRRCTSCNKYQ